jgi:hypothetical protein
MNLDIVRAVGFVDDMQLQHELVGELVVVARHEQHCADYRGCGRTVLCRR